MYRAGGFPCKRKLNLCTWKYDIGWDVCFIKNPFSQFKRSSEMSLYSDYVV